MRSVTRRDLLAGVASLGGVNVAYGMLERLSLVERPAGTDLESLVPRESRKETVLILGAGLAGLCAAYELERLGYRCEILEARHRTGGRATTVRGGTLWEEKGGRQECRFERDHYYNPGPARIPYWHVTVDYCRTLGVPLAPFVNVNEGAYVYQTAPGKLSGVKVRQRDVIADTVGEMAEIAYRSVARGTLEGEVTMDERREILTYLREYGFLERDGKYRGTGRRGYRSFEPTGTSEIRYEEPMAFASLFSARMGNYFEFINGVDQQMTMMEPVGGMDAIPKAFERAIRTPIRFGAEIVDVKTSESGVEVSFRDAEGKTHVRKADYAVCTIPLPVLRKIPANLDAAATAAIKGTVYGNAMKVATEYKRRFWEEDERVFGGITWTDQAIYTILYPSHGFLGRSGVLVNYAFGGGASRFGTLDFAARGREALAQTAKIHPQAAKEALSAMSVVWAQVPYSEGAYAVWEMTPGATEKYAKLCEPQGRLYFAGEHQSRLTAWMAGALESARATVKAIHLRAIA